MNKKDLKRLIKECILESYLEDNDYKYTASDGKVYKIVKIGKQIWMAENLAYKTGTGSKAYNSNQRNVSVYGEEYSWESAIKACPSGWHLPTDDEWYTLIVYLGGRDVAGGKLKSTSIWTRPNTGATNSSGFTALPIFRQGEYGTTIDEYGIWWGSDLAGYPSVRTLQYDDSKVGYSGGTELAGGGYYSIRCIRD